MPPTALPFPSIALGDFELHDTLGTGSFGRVRLVHHAAPPPNGTAYALKSLHKGLLLKLGQVMTLDCS